MKLLFLFCLAYGFVYVNIVFYEMSVKAGINEDEKLAMIAVNITIIVPFLFGITLFGLTSLLLAFFNMSFGKQRWNCESCDNFRRAIEIVEAGWQKNKNSVART